MTCKKAPFSISNILEKSPNNETQSQDNLDSPTTQSKSQRVPTVSASHRSPITDVAQGSFHSGQHRCINMATNPTLPLPFLLPPGLRTSGIKATSSSAFSESQSPLWFPQPSHKPYLHQSPQDVPSYNHFGAPLVPAFFAGGGSGIGGLNQTSFLNSAQSLLAAQQSHLFPRQPDILEAIRAQYDKIISPDDKHLINLSLEVCWWQQLLRNELHPALWTTLLDLKGSGRRKGGQIRFSSEQTQRLEATFEKSKYLTPQERKSIAKALDLSERQVKTWFQNRRAKWRRVKQESPTGKYDVISSDSDDDRDPGHHHSFTQRVLT